MAKGFSKHSQRLGDQILREVADILLLEIQDPRLEMLTVSSVRMSPNGRIARVLYVAQGDVEHVANVAEALEQAKGYVRKQLAARLRTRYLPELEFSRDDLFQEMYG